MLGSSANALAEFAEARALAPSAIVVAVNDSLRVCPERPTAFVTLHHEKVRDRFFRGIAPGEMAKVAQFGIRSAHGFEPTIVAEKWGGTSGLFAVQIALERLGCDGVILAGVPLDPAAGVNYQRTAKQIARGDAWAGSALDRYRRGWMKALPEIASRVRSVSGWTRNLLGAPDPDWMACIARERRSMISSSALAS